MAGPEYPTRCDRSWNYVRVDGERVVHLDYQHARRSLDDAASE